MRHTRKVEALEVGQRYMMPSGRTAVIYKMYKNYEGQQEVSMRYEKSQIKGQGEFVDFSEHNVRSVCFRLAQK